jgi:NADPH:quinone reductase-like Zn-dependent oxidoreductase
MKYKRIIITHPGGPEVLQMVEDDVPEPQPGMAGVKIFTAGVAFADVALRRGTYPAQASAPVTPGYDIVGVVDKLAADVTGITVGRESLH